MESDDEVYDEVYEGGYGSPYEYRIRRCKWNPFRWEVIEVNTWAYEGGGGRGQHPTKVIRSNLTKTAAEGFKKLLTT